MICKFSETQFMFGILHELVSQCWKPEKAWSTVKFPTQREEKKKGYDCTIEGAVRSLFFQFKVPEKKTTANAKHWSTFGAPYYKFKIWPDSMTPQHNKLVDLAKEDPRNKVYYCSPGFHTNEEFNENYANKRLSTQSIYVPCGSLPKISGEDWHDICYTLAPARIYKMHSEEFSIEAFDIEGLKRDVENATPYESVHKCLIDIAEKFSVNVRDVEDDRARFDIIANDLLMRRNLNMILLGE